MSQDQETILCKCFLCKGENPELGGKFVSKSTFRRHRKKESIWNISILSNNLEYFSNSHLNSVEERYV